MSKIAAGGGGVTGASPTIPKNRLYRREKQAGFTLVEVIVVLVILAILAAIAIPALTGYIDKAQNSEWISKARNAAMAVRTVVSEAYASGVSAADAAYINNGQDGWYNAAGSNVKLFYLGSFASSQGSVNKEAAALMGETYPDPVQSGNTSYGGPGSWDVVYLAPKTSDYTAFDAPAFIYRYYPDGQTSGKTFTMVTYGVADLDASGKTWTQIANALRALTDPIDLSAAYRVYYDCK
ncbi:MAG: prepilin-type N-terminal cleavage/methylation domain-containing protein [Coriobacteriales bacterium]|nr:prepilin-type N-terminal cleavage/methylation domain-containing protein [Coriobacteriales bacterium]